MRLCKTYWNRVSTERWYAGAMLICPCGDCDLTLSAVIPVRLTRHYVIVLDPLRGERRVTIRKFEAARRLLGNWVVTWERL